jgi:hypothetical protein
MLDYDFRTAFRSVGSSKTENDYNLFQIVNLDFQDLLQVPGFFNIVCIPKVVHLN